MRAPARPQVATKRVKHAIKSDIPSIADHISKLLHVGKATVDKLVDLRAAFAEEGFDVPLPDELAHVEKVGQFKQLVELSENSNDLRGKVGAGRGACVRVWWLWRWGGRRLDGVHTHLCRQCLAATVRMPGR
jgi:hypothetical protein